jgi:hypothetical protein
MTTARKRAMAIVTTVAGSKEGNATVARAIVRATRVAGKQIDVALINYRIFLCHDIFLLT